MQLDVITKKDLEPMKKALEQMQSRWKEWSPLFAGDILTDDDLIRMLKVSRRTLSTYRKEGVITYSKVGKLIWYTKSDVLNFLKKHRNE